MKYKIVRFLDDWYHRAYMKTHWKLLDRWSPICDLWERLNEDPNDRPAST